MRRRRGLGSGGVLVVDVRGRSLLVGGGLTLGGDLIVQRIEAGGLRAIEVEPPIADEVVLVEDGSVGAEERVLGEAALTVGGANVEHLALSLGIGVITCGKEKNMSEKRKCLI